MARRTTRVQGKGYHPTVRLWLARFAASADYFQGSPGAFSAACNRAGLRYLPSGSRLTARDFEKLRLLEREAELDALRASRQKRRARGVA